MLFSDSVLSIKNIGKERAKKLEKLNIYTVNDIIEYFPRAYDDRSNISKIKDIEKDKKNTIIGRIVGTVQNIKSKNITISKAKIFDGETYLDIVWYNRAYIKKALIYSREYIFTGKVIEKYDKLVMESPDYEIIDNTKENLSNGRIVPIYSSTNKLSQKILRAIIKDVLDEMLDKIEEFLPKGILEKYNFCDRPFAIENIHFPKDEESFFKARERLVFEELFLIQIMLFKIKGFIENKETDINIEDKDINDIIEILPFKLTLAQQKVLEDIYIDFSKGKVINRLIQGDVGSGKTVIAQIVAYIVVKNGYQVGLMAPTDVLAKQHFEGFKKLFDKLGIECVFLSGSQRAKEKKEAITKVSDGSAKIVIGTNAIIQDKINFKNLGLVITDEQHRFGVRQREGFGEKGKSPHTIVMTATPIPRTLALILYGDLDISVIDKLPPGRQKIDTLYVNSTYYERVYKFLKNNADEKRQAYIICPMIEENEKMELKSVLAYTQKLKEEVFYNYSIECIHGKMKNDEKQDIMDRFYKGDIDILVSTTVIEVGINVPNATIMLIENAERFGISQLHQLRGRVGRGAEKSYCILLSDSKNKASIARLKIMVEHSDGFILSEKDLELRGSGDFFGTRQHGIPEMKIANLYKDTEALKLAQKVAIDLYRKDANLDMLENILLKQKIEEIFNQKQNNITL